MRCIKRPLGALAIGLTLLSGGFGPVACVIDPLTEASPFRDGLLRQERAGTRAGARYASPDPSGFSRPDGVGVVGDTLFVWSSQSRSIQALSLRPENYAGALPATQVAASIRRCKTSRQSLVCLTFNGTLFEVDSPGATRASAALDALASHGGYVDFLQSSTRPLLWVLDAVSQRLITIARPGPGAGEVIHQAPMSNAYALGDAGAKYLFALRWTAPRLQLVPKDPTSHQKPIAIQLQAPLRAAFFDSQRGHLWTVGPQQARARRDGGPLRNLRSQVLAFDLVRLVQGDSRPLKTYDLGAVGVVDGVAVGVDDQGLPIVAAAGSDVLWQPTSAPVATGAQPAALTPLPNDYGGGWAWPNRLDHSVTLKPEQGPPRTIVFATPTHDLVSLGERLYYSAKLWKTAANDAYTCNSCHWDTGSDHRRHPGFLERRWEITRPLDGISMVSPIFSTGGAATLSDALEGLVRGLDRRMWDGTEHGAWWLEARTLMTAAGAVTLTAEQVRKALMAFLLQIPVRRPALAAKAQTDGWDVFKRDCSGCHEASSDMRTRLVTPNKDVLSRLADGPLTFGNPGWAKTGPTPYFTPYGNRISPLLHLSRGGPFFTNGSAATLTDVLTSNHGRGEKPPLTSTEAAALRRFLLAL